MPNIHPRIVSVSRSLASELCPTCRIHRCFDYYRKLATIFLLAFIAEDVPAGAMNLRGGTEGRETQCISSPDSYPSGGSGWLLGSTMAATDGKKGQDNHYRRLAPAQDVSLCVFLTYQAICRLWRDFSALRGRNEVVFFVLFFGLSFPLSVLGSQERFRVSAS